MYSMIASGLYADVIADGAIDVDRWRACHRERLAVGRCGCGAELFVQPGPRGGATDDTGRVRFFTAECASCRGELVSPGGRLGQRHRPVKRPAPAPQPLPLGA
jgi:hypothetical protein